MGERVGVVWDDRFSAYDFGSGHPMAPVRVQLAMRLAAEFGLLTLPGVQIIGPVDPAEDVVLLRVHEAAYIDAVRRASDDPQFYDSGRGLGTADDPVFPGMHEASARIAQGSRLAALAVQSGEVDHGVNLAGGLHHAMPGAAEGFCVYNDAAVAIAALLDGGAERVAYLDIDVHHGDGTQWIFFEDPRVLTCSVHETGRYLFPGTGGIAERGVGAAEGTAINIPLPPYAGDRPYLRAIEDVILPAVAEFGPDVIVTQDGADPHHADPLAHLQVTMSAFPRAYRALHELARAEAGGRWVALGGGGYTFQVVPRAWTMLFAEMLGVELDDEIPEAWWSAGERALGVPLPRRMSEDPEPEVSMEERIRADVEGDRVVDEVRALFLG